MTRVLIATSNPGKLRDFAGAAAPLGIAIESLPNFASIPTAVEDGLTFEANARKKAEYYSAYAPGEIVLADDSGLEVDALGGAPGVHSARYAADQPHLVGNNTDDQANNARLIRELRKIPPENRTGRFVCVIAAARDGQTLNVFRGQAEGMLLDSPARLERIRLRSAVLFSVHSKNLRRTDPRRKSPIQPPRRSLPPFLDWYHSVLTRTKKLRTENWCS